MSDYAPFPERELLELAESYEFACGYMHPSPMRDRYAGLAVMLRNTVACHTALRERCLTAELRERCSDAS